MSYINRAGWGARKPESVTGDTTFKGVAIHYEGVKLGVFPHSKCAGKVKGIQAFHMDSRGYADIAYNYLVCPHGDVYEGRGKGVRSAANGNGQVNSDYLAVCYLSGPGDPVTDAGKVGLRAAIARCGFAPATTTTHRIVRQGTTECPGKLLIEWVAKGCPVPKAASQPAPAAPPKPAAPPAPPQPPQPVREAPRMIVKFSAPDVYEVVGSRLEHVNLAAFQARGLNSTDVTKLPDTHPLAKLPRS